MNKQYQDLIEKYNAGQATQSELVRIEQLLEQGLLEISDLTAIDELHKGIENISVPEPSERLSNNFYSMLAREKKANGGLTLVHKITQLLEGFGLSPQGIRLAYTTALLIIGIGVGWIVRPDYAGQLDTLTGEIQHMREMMMLSMLEKPSVIERLKAVNLSSQMNQVDEKVIDALLTTLNNDENVNVRLATIEALLNYADYPEVRKGLIDAIAHQESGMVQIALAEAMVALKEKNSVEELKKILKQDSLEEGVEEKINESINKLI